MTAKEIREQFGTSDNLQTAILAEIAAQLAETNANYEDFKKHFTSNGAIDVAQRGV